MPIPERKKKEEQPALGSWQSFVFLGLIGTACSSILIFRGGFRMNRNLNVMQRFFTTHSDKLGKLVEHTPPAGKDTIFRQNVHNIVQTAQQIAEDKIPDKREEKHKYPEPTFPSTRFSPKRTLYSAQPKDDDNRNGNNNADSSQGSASSNKS
eukprot:CAMPEP_0197035966 /NCGR_PEP_ID=MMETSP1384-20130603/13609_1 /TAXON_ID=29189 /ORGANISM="Ammonia sp." /LENGTH=151 /DNA_ID=CAMNT_0042466085 /DNA_START=31 /DNA_END=486 /DNA_ORIENTATION=+